MPYPRGWCECRIQRIYVWTCLGSFVSFVLGTVALGSPSYTEGRYGGFEYLRTGLLLFCSSKPNDTPTSCAPLLFGSLEGWFSAVQGLSLLCWVFLFTTFVVSLVLHFQDDNHIFSLPVVLTGLLSGVIGVVAAIVFAVAWMTQTVFDKYDVRLSWGYAVYIIWHVITIFLFSAMCIAGKDIWINQFKMQRHHK